MRSARSNSRGRRRGSRWHWSGWALRRMSPRTPGWRGSDLRLPRSIVAFSDDDRGRTRRCRSAPEPAGGIPPLVCRRPTVSLKDRVVAASLAAVAALAEPPRAGGPGRVSTDRVGVRIDGRALRACAAAVPGDVSAADQAAHAALRQDRPEQRFPAEPHHDAPDADAGGVLRTVSLARVGRALRGAI